MTGQTSTPRRIQWCVCARKNFKADPAVATRAPQEAQKGRETTKHFAHLEPQDEEEEQILFGLHASARRLALGSALRDAPPRRERRPAAPAAVRARQAFFAGLAAKMEAPPLCRVACVGPLAMLRQQRHAIF